MKMVFWLFVKEEASDSFPDTVGADTDIMSMALQLASIDSLLIVVFVNDADIALHLYSRYMLLNVIAADK